MPKWRPLIRGILAFTPMVTLCGIAGYLSWGLLSLKADAGIFPTVKELLIFSLGALATNTSSAVSYYFKQDTDELQGGQNGAISQ